MAFASTINDNAVPNRLGDKKRTSGTYTSDGSDTGGDIDTGLRICEGIYLQPKGSSVGNAPMVNETLPVDGSAVTIKTDSNEIGYWEAWGQ